MSLALLSVVGAIGRAGLRKEVGLLRPGPRGPNVLRHLNGTMMCRGHGVPEMVTPAMRTTAVLLGFLNLTNCHVQFCHDKFMFIYVYLCLFMFIYHKLNLTNCHVQFCHDKFKFIYVYLCLFMFIYVYLS